MGHAVKNTLRRLAAQSGSLLPIALALQSSFASANGHDTMELLERESRIFMAARHAYAIEKTSANVTVIGREQIRRFGYRTIHEAPASLPVVYYASSQWPALGMRGIAVPDDFGSRILYLVNDMPMYEATYGGFFMEYLDIESIERIEFIKGAGSALYGSGGVHGSTDTFIAASAFHTSGRTVYLSELARKARRARLHPCPDGACDPGRARTMPGGRDG